MSFGGDCNSNLHFLDRASDDLWTTCSSMSNKQVLREYIDAMVDFRSLWSSNSGGGWPCANGGLVHPLAAHCCCGESHTLAIAYILLGLRSNINKKLKKANRSQSTMLDISYVLEVAVKVWTPTWSLTCSKKQV